MAGSFRKQGHRASPGQVGPHPVKHLPVLGEVGSGVLAPLDRNRPHGSHQHSDDRHTEERSFGKEGHRPRSETQDEERIDQGIGMVENEEQGALPGDPLLTAGLDPPKEDPEHQSEDRDEQGSQGSLGL